MLVRFFLLIMWLLQCLPIAILAPLGKGLGALLYLLARERRHVTLTNLRLCFPHMTEAERVAVAKQHFAAFGRSFLERPLTWWASAERYKRLVRVEGLEHWIARKGAPTILFVPHFAGLDMGATRLAMEIDGVSMYSKQKSATVDKMLLKGRSRFGDQRLYSRQDGLRQVLRGLKDGYCLYYLPDMDYGPRDAIFVPFFAFPAATITGLSRVATLSGAKVLTVVTRMEKDGWAVHIGPKWQNFPTGDLAVDTRRMNAELEAEILQDPQLLPQYLWMHKRFKTRPEGEKRVY